MRSKTIISLASAAMLVGAAGLLGYRAGLDGAGATSFATTPDIAAPTFIEELEDDPQSPSVFLEQPVTPDQPGIETLADTLKLPTDFLQTAALYALVERADLRMLKRHVKEAMVLDSSTDRTAALSIVYLRFSEINPNAAVDHLYASGAPGRDNVLYTMFFSWAKRDLDAAVARSKRVSSSADRSIIANAIMRAFADRDLEFMRKLAERVSPNPSSAGHYTAQFLAAKADTNPLEALRLAMALESPEERRLAIYQVAQAWSRNDPWAAYRHAGTVTDKELAQQLRSGSLYRMAEQDPEQTLALLDGDLSRREKSLVLSAAMGQLAQRDPQRALAFAQNLGDYELQNEALGTVFSSWAQMDPQAAAWALEQIDNPAVRQNAGWSVASAFARKEPKLALEWAYRLEGRAGDIYRSVIGEIAQADPELALASLSKLAPSNNRSQLESTVLSYLAQSDPAVAVTYADDMPRGPGRDQALISITSTWANTDPTSAMEWVLTRSAAEQSQLLSTVAYGLAADNPELALGYIDRLEGAPRNDWIANVMSTFTYQNPQVALDWLADHQNDPQHDQWLQTVLGGLANSDPLRAIDLLSTMSDPETIASARQQIAWQWANQDPQATARWIASLPSDERNAALVQAAVSNWQNFDPDAAQAWVNSLDEGPGRDAGLMALINNNTMNTREVRSVLARISDDTVRLDAAQQHAFGLISSDPAAARNFIESIDFSEDISSWLLQMLDDANG